LIPFFDLGSYEAKYSGTLGCLGVVELWADALGLQKLYLKDQHRFKGQGDVIG
jgi:hypothetical protein